MTAAQTPTPQPPTTRALSPEQVRAHFDAHRTVRQYVTNADGTPKRLPADHLEAVLHAAQRAPTDASAQLYSFIHLTDPQVRQKAADLTTNAHVATASEVFIVCADIRRVKQILDAAGYEPAEYPAIAVHFGIGDAVLAGQNLLTAAEMLGYQGCWIGGVMNDLEGLLELLRLPEGVLPFAALTVGQSAEQTPYRPRLPRPLVVHTDAYRDGSPDELRGGIEVMNPLAARNGQPGDWAKLMNAYFGTGGSMAKREPHLVAALKRQGLHAGNE